MVTIAAVALGAIGMLFAFRAFATQPPPPVTYQLDMSRSGGDGNCVIGAEPPAPLVWHVDSFNEVYAAGTQVDILADTICPTEYRFDHWWSNNPTIDGTRAEDGFYIHQDTTIIAYFVPLAAKVTGFTVSNVDFNEETGLLFFEHTWGSTSGNLANLSGQEVYEVLAHAPDVEFDPGVLEFLCTGQWSTTENYTYASPWDIFGALPKIMRLAGTTPAQNGYCPDQVTRLQQIPPACVGYCSYTLSQWIVASAGSRSYLVNDKNYVERSFNNFGGVWNYCVSSRGSSFCTEKTW